MCIYVYIYIYMCIYVYICVHMCIYVYVIIYRNIIRPEHSEHSAQVGYYYYH